MARESNNGLTASDEALLRERLAEVERLHNSGPYFGWFERDKIRVIFNKLKNRLDPAKPQELNDEALALVELFGASLDESVACMQRPREVVEAVDEALGRE
jgi:hypothetical protein